jgi:hypothetical protein
MTSQPHNRAPIHRAGSGTCHSSSSSLLVTDRSTVRPRTHLPASLQAGSLRCGHFREGGPSRPPAFRAHRMEPVAAVRSVPGHRPGLGLTTSCQALVVWDRSPASHTHQIKASALAMQCGRPGGYVGWPSWQRRAGRSRWVVSYPRRGCEWCMVQLPGRALVDIETIEEYVVAAVRAIHRYRGRQVSLVDHSQGTDEIRGMCGGGRTFVRRGRPDYYRTPTPEHPQG